MGSWLAYGLGSENRNLPGYVVLRSGDATVPHGGDQEYRQRVIELRRRRFYGKDAEDKAGILRYTKVSDAVLDITDIPVPSNERELAWVLSFLAAGYWFGQIPTVKRNFHIVILAIAYVYVWRKGALEWQ